MSSPKLITFVVFLNLNVESYLRTIHYCLTHIASYLIMVRKCNAILSGALFSCHDKQYKSLTLINNPACLVETLL